VKTGSPKRIPIIRESAIANDWLLSGPRREQLNGKIGRFADAPSREITTTTF